MSQHNTAARLAGEREAGVACPHCGQNVPLGASIAVCPACGTVHHQACWEARQGCGSYVCSPARRALVPGDEIALKISAAELEQARPLPTNRPFTVPPAAFPPSRPLPRWNRLAIASLVCAVAGIPLFGILTGIVAIVLGGLALGALRTTRQRGTGLAVTGVLLGLADTVAWVFFLYHFLFQGGGGVPFTLDDARPPDAQMLADLPPHIGRAMRANVLVQGQRGWGAGGGVAIGSGVILKIERGEALLITNRHVVDPSFSGEEGKEPADWKDLTVDIAMVGQARDKGRVVWLAPGGIDLALVRVPCHSRLARAARWQMRRPLKIDDAVFAIGNPHNLGWTLTRGSISQFRTRDVGGRRIRVIQTQTTINPGNSGGGLYDQEGFLIAIPTWTQDKRVSEGLNFAVALDTLLQVNPPGLDLEAGSEALK